MKKIIVLTGNELRHQFFRTYLGSFHNIQILKTYCESGVNLKDKVIQENVSDNRTLHLQQREQVEIDFFQIFTQQISDNSRPVLIQKGEINEEEYVKEIINYNPDIIVSYGCSIIKSRLLLQFKNRFINIHLGLSPYYRGSGTNFWPFVNCEPGFIGVTFMHIDEGIDTGQIIHQIRAEIFPWDNIHTIGNRLIIKAAKYCHLLLINFEKLIPIPEIFFPSISEKHYKNKDFNEMAVLKANQNLKEGMLEKYLVDKKSFDEKFPIYENSGINFK